LIDDPDKNSREILTNENCDIAKTDLSLDYDRKIFNSIKYKYPFLLSDMTLLDPY